MIKKFEGLILSLALILPISAIGQVYMEVPSWQYVPVDSIFWEKVKSLQQKKDLLGVISLAEEKLQNAKSELEQAETHYVTAMACLGLQYTFCTYNFSMELLRKNPGSMPAIGALFLLEELLQEELIVDDEIQRVLNVGNFVEVPGALLPMSLYYVFKDNRKKNLKEWQQDNYKRIPEKTYWRNRLAFYKILNLVKVGKPKQAEKELLAIEKASEKYPKFKERIRLQRARLFYQMGQFKEADSIYSGFLSQSREFGKILLERAWVKYSQKDFSLALGMLESLKSSYFKGATHPEQYILSMVTYRDLCHYEAVIEAHKEFESVFKPWVDHLKEQKPLFENRAILTMVLLQAQNIPIGNMIGRIRLEQENLKQAKFSQAFSKKLETLYTEGEARWKDFASQALDGDLKTASVEFLDFVEQAKLLDYISGLDQHRIKARFESRNYKAPQAQKYAIQKLFWPVLGEYWWSEINTYRVLASDRCTEGGTK